MAGDLTEKEPVCDTCHERAFSLEQWADYPPGTAAKNHPWLALW